MTDNLFNNTSTPAFLDPSEDRVTIDVLKDANTQLRETMLANYEPNKLKQQTEFSAICLMQLDNLSIGNQNVVRIKARIPELHSMFPVPKDVEDYKSIAVYPTFIALGNSFNPQIQNGTVAPGTRLTVTFTSMANFGGPTIKSISNITDGVVGSIIGNTKKKNKRKGPPPKPGTLKDYLKGLTKSTGPLARYGNNHPFQYYLHAYGSPHANPTTVYPVKASYVRFVGFKRRGKRSPKGVVLHHGAGTGGLRNTAQSLWSRGKFGTHYVIDKDGSIYCLTNPRYRVSHAGGGYNKYIGIDMANGPAMKAGSTTFRTPAQVEAAWQLVNYLAQKYKFGLSVPAEPNVGIDGMTDVPLSRLQNSGAKIKHKISGAGKTIHSHAEVGHGDGDFAKLYIIIRMTGKGPATAYAHAKQKWLEAAATKKVVRTAIIDGKPKGGVRTGPANKAKSKIKNVIPVGFISRDRSIELFGQATNDQIVEMNNYTGKAYTHAELTEAIKKEPKWTAPLKGLKGE